MMGISNAFRELASVFEAFETTEIGAELTTIRPLENDVLRNERLSAQTTVQIPFVSNDLLGANTEVVAEAVSLSDDGSLEIELQITTATEQKDTPSDHDTEEPASETSNTETKEREAQLSEQVETETISNHEQPTKPAYRDPEQLQAVYEAHETFQEMTDALEVDVSPQTVRRYMIKHGIHTPSSTSGQRAATTLLKTDAEDVFEGEGPNTRLRTAENSSHDTDMDDLTSSPKGGQKLMRQSSRDSGSAPHPTDSTNSSEKHDSSGSSATQSTERAKSNNNGAGSEHQPDQNTSEKVVADEKQATNEELTGDEADLKQEELAGDLPDHLSLEEIKTTVQNAKTLYEVQQELELDRDRARSLLQELNLLELVQGRLSTRGLQERTMEEINRRIQTNHSQATAQSSTTHS